MRNGKKRRKKMVQGKRKGIGNGNTTAMRKEKGKRRKKKPKKVKKQKMREDQALFPNLILNQHGLSKV